VRWGDVEDEEGEPEFFGLTKKIIGVERGVAGGQGLQSFGLTTTTAGGGGESLWRPRPNLSNHPCSRGKKKRM
jgi:hypothetical protein